MPTNSEESESTHDIFKQAESSSNEIETGQLVFLKTPLEVRNQTPLVDVYITAVPIRQVSSTLDLIRKLLPNDGDAEFNHLRRVVKHEHLPTHLQPLINPTNDSSALSTTRFLIAGATNSISHTELSTALSATSPDPQIWTAPVPSLPPTTPAQATLWTAQHWPSIYKKTNPFGPHPYLVSCAADEIRPDTQKYLDLASAAADDTISSGRGERVGVVVVERKNGVARVMAVAGDARWHEWPRASAGNAAAHAVLRAVAMVAAGLKEREDSSGPSPDAKVEEGKGGSIFRDGPNGELEREYYNPGADKDGYLCHELEIYCTHEPCVMCSMAIVHSRFGRLVFGQRMVRTGGICADGGLGHGLFWKRQLNWTLMAWEWIRKAQELEENIMLNA